MGMGFAPTCRLRRVNPPASQIHFNHCALLPVCSGDVDLVVRLSDAASPDCALRAARAGGPPSRPARRSSCLRRQGPSRTPAGGRRLAARPPLARLILPQLPRNGESACESRLFVMRLHTFGRFLVCIISVFFILAHLCIIIAIIICVCLLT